MCVCVCWGAGIVFVFGGESFWECRIKAASAAQQKNKATLPTIVVCTGGAHLLKPPEGMVDQCQCGGCLHNKLYLQWANRVGINQHQCPLVLVGMVVARDVFF